MKCNNCGAENTNDAVFCFNCGSAVANSSQPYVGQMQDTPEIQPQYGYEQPQYSYEQPQHSYEQTEYTSKKSNKGMLITLIIVAFLVLALGVFGYVAVRKGWIELNFNKEQSSESEEAAGTEVIVIGANKTYQYGNVELWLVEPKKYQGAVNPAYASADYISPLADDQNSNYFSVSLCVKNVSDKDIDFENLYIEGSLNDKYNLNWEQYYESEDGTMFEYNPIIKPGEIKTVYFVCSVPNKEADSYKKITLSFGFDAKFSSKPISKGKDACEYIFEFKGVK